MSTNPSGLWTIRFGELGATLKTFQDNGVTLDHLARLRSDAEYAKRVAEFIRGGGLEAFTDQKLARAILGQNIFGPEEWSALYGVRFTKAQLRRVAEFPWSEDVLNAPCPFHKGRRVAETHFAFLGLDRLNGKPLTIMKWHDLHSRTGHPRFYSDAPLYREQTFATERMCELRWYLMLVNIIPNSEHKTYTEQLRDCLPSEYEVPTAIAEVTKDVLYHRKRGQYPNSTRWGRTKDMISCGCRVYVGSCNESVDVDYWREDHCYDDIGLAASRKSPSTSLRTD
jgi:hypothetical protein